eukprot:5135442-Prymnesium_polylepis.1
MVKKSWAAALLLPSVVLCWTSTSQTLYGAQIGDIRQQQHGNSSDEHIPTQQALGYLWSLPESTLDERGLGGGIAWAWDPA